MMPYYLSYKGKKLGPPMSKSEAEAKWIVLSRCVRQLEIVKETRFPRFGRPGEASAANAHSHFVCCSKRHLSGS